MTFEYREECINVTDFENTEDVLNEIASLRLEKSFLVCNLNEVVYKFKLWEKLTSRVQLYYAIRCNNDVTVLKILSRLNVGFVCVSKSELEQVVSIGVDPSRIIFGRTMKFPSHIQFASNCNVKFLTFDNKEELLKVARIFPNADAIIHIRNDLIPKTLFELKIGCDPHTEAEDLLKFAASLSIKVIGVCFTIDEESDLSSICNSLNAARHLFTIAKSVGYNFSLLYISGECVGNPGHKEAVYKFSPEVNLAIARYFPDDQIKIVFEDGSFLVRSAFMLANCIFGIKTRDGKRHYYVNDGTYQNFNCITYWNTKTLPHSIPATNGVRQPSVIWGSTCDSIDLLHSDILLPKLNCGDWIVFNNVGSHTFVLSTNFNSFGDLSVYFFINIKNGLQLNILNAANTMRHIII